MIDYIKKIKESKSIKEVKKNTTAFLKHLRNNNEKKEFLCYQLTCMLKKFWKESIEKFTDDEMKTTIIPPDVAPVFLMLTVVPESGSAENIIRGLKEFVKRCSEFSDPESECISEKEIHMVLKRAQNLGVLDMITQNRALKIISLANTHYIHNSECGIVEKALSTPEAIIFVYHPHGEIFCDKVFVFSHEIGHGLHLALTGDVEIIPDGFDAFNKSIGVEESFDDDTIKEAFADVVAFALLGKKEYKKYIPEGNELTDEAFANLAKFETYIKKVIRAYKN